MAASTAEKTKVPRPVNCFLVFRLEKQGEITAMCPGANHRDISKILAKWWKELPEQEKEQYRERARLAKIEHTRMYPDYKYCPTKKDTNRKRRKYSRKTQSKFTSRKEENNRIMEMLYENPKSYKTSAPSLSPSNGMATQQTTPTLLECSVDSPSELSSCYSIPSPNIPEMPLTDEQSVVVKEEDIATGNQVYQETFHDLLDFSSQCAVYDNTMLTWLHERIYSSAGYAPNHPATPLYINPQLLTLNTSSQFEET